MKNMIKCLAVYASVCAATIMGCAGANWLWENVIEDKLDNLYDRLQSKKN